jgi:hypothetical protein
LAYNRFIGTLPKGDHGMSWPERHHAHGCRGGKENNEELSFDEKHHFSITALRPRQQFLKMEVG